MSGARNNAVMEARKWLEEKKSGSDSKLKMEDRIYATDHGALSLVRNLLLVFWLSYDSYFRIDIYLFLRTLALWISGIHFKSPCLFVHLARRL